MTHVVQVVYAMGLGGSEILASAIAAAGVQRGTRMSLCALYPGEQLQDRLLKAGIDGYVLGKKDGFQPGAMVAMWRLLRRLGPTTVITHHLGQLVYAGIAARMPGAQLIHVEHEWYSLAAKKARRMLRLSSTLADTVVVPARSIARFVQHNVGVPGHKISIIHNGIDLTRFTLRSPRDGRGPIVGTVGRLDPAKDHLTLLAAFRQIACAYPAAQLVVVGEGQTRPLIESYIRDHGLSRHVQLAGARPDVEAMLSTFDVFILSSVQEGVPIALLEAMACGVPVVATEVGAIPETLADGAVGRLVPPNNPEVLSQVVLDLLRHPASSAALTGAARRHVESQHDLAKTVAAYLALCIPPPRRSRQVA